MKIADIDPRVTNWADGRSRKVGNWSFTDRVEVGCRVREVRHYSTRMVLFSTEAATVNVWHVQWVGIGHGSVSDQGGINQLAGSYGFRYHRDARGGGPRVVNVVTGEVVAD